MKKGNVVRELMTKDIDVCLEIYEDADTPEAHRLRWRLALLQATLNGFFDSYEANPRYSTSDISEAA